MADARPDGEPRRYLIVYAVAAVSYIGLGVIQKGILNWVVGPIWLIVAVVIAGRFDGRRTP